MAKKTTILIMFFLILVFQAEAQGSPRSNGIYYAQLNHLTMYLRFFDDGRVISANVPGKYTEINRWFNIRYNESVGKYSFAGKDIVFKIESEDGSVEYKGRTGGKDLTVDIHSLINGYTQKKVTFKFQKF